MDSGEDRKHSGTCCLLLRVWSAPWWPTRRVLHVFDFTDPSVAINRHSGLGLFVLHQNCLTLACWDCFAALSPATSQNANMQHDACLTPRNLFCSLSSCIVGFYKQPELGEGGGGWVWLQMVRVDYTLQERILFIATV